MAMAHAADESVSTETSVTENNSMLVLDIGFTQRHSSIHRHFANSAGRSAPVFFLLG
jgi:hypothetical protein